MDSGSGSATARLLRATVNAAPRRRPQQARARFTVAAILEAAALVIDDVGWGRASTNRIAERAGVSIGSLYQYFPNKEAILASLHDAHHRDIHDVVAKNLKRIADPQVALDDGIRGLFQGLIRLHRDDPVVSRVLSKAVPALPVSTREAPSPGHDHEALIRLLSSRPDVRVEDLSTTARIVEITIEALTRWMVHEAPADADLDAFVDHSVAMLSGYLSLRRVERP